MSRAAALAAVAAAALAAGAAREAAADPTFIQVVQPLDGEQIRSLVPLVELVGAAGTGARIRDHVVIALDISQSTFKPSGLDLDSDGIVGALRFKDSLIDSGRLDGSYLKWTSDYDDTVHEAALATARALVRKLDPETSRVALITFRGKQNVQAPLGPPSAVLEALDALSVHLKADGTNLEAALLSGVDLLTAPSEPGAAPAGPEPEPNLRRTICVLSDGDPTMYNGFMPGLGTGASDKAINRRARRAALRAAELAAERGVRVDTYALAGKPEELKALREVAEITGGYAFPLQLPSAARFEHDPPVLAGLARVEIKNLTSQAPARAQRMFRDGSFDAYVPLQVGSNRIEIRATLDDGTVLRAVREVSYEEPAERSNELLQEAEVLRNAVAERTRETQLATEMRERRPERRHSLDVEVVH